MFARLYRTFKLLSKHHFIHRSNILWRLPRFKAEYIKFIQSGGAKIGFFCQVPLLIINDIIITSLPTEVIYMLVNFLILSDTLLGIFRFMTTTKGIWISPMNSIIDDVIYVFLSIKLYLDVGRGENMYISRATLMPVSWAVWTYSRGSVASGARSPGRRKQKKARSK